MEDERMATADLVPSWSRALEGSALRAEVVEFVRRRLPDDTLAHSARVATFAQTEEERIVALLHDAVEDGHATLGELHDLGIPPTLVSAVDILTRDEDRIAQTYDDYIALVLASLDLDAPGARIAARVKMYDIFDHLHPHLVGKIKRKRVKRYVAALRKLALAQARKPVRAVLQDGAFDEAPLVEGSFRASSGHDASA
jgi:hypothetical protein